MGLVSCYIPRRAFRRVEEMGTTRAWWGAPLGSTLSTAQPHLSFQVYLTFKL